MQAHEQYSSNATPTAHSINRTADILDIAQPYRRLLSLKRHGSDTPTTLLSKAHAVRAFLTPTLHKRSLYGVGSTHTQGKMMTKKLTPAAIALLEAARSGVPGAMRASIAEIVKDAPQIPGIVALEKEYGAGNIPLTAVHASNLLSLEDKKFLFQIAGFEYDGTMPEKKLQTKEIPQSVITGMSASAFFKRIWKRTDATQAAECHSRDSHTTMR